jgi:protein involved in polysaccharide export with SLBB domain
MPVRRRNRILAGLGLALGTWSATGSVTPSPLVSLAAATEPPALVRMAGPEPTQPTGQPVLTPKSVVEWSAEATKGPAVPGIRGKGVLTIEGQIDLGPYGTMSIRGMTVQQASDAIAKHLAHYLKSPRVRLTAMIPSAEPSQTPTAVQPASHTTTTPHAPAHVTLPAPDPVETTPILAPPGEVSRLKAVPQGKPLLADTGIKRTSFEVRDDTKPSMFAQGREDPDGPNKGGPDKKTDTDDKDKPETLPAPTPMSNGHPPPPFLDGHESPGLPPTELSKQALPSYRVGPPDILRIEYPLPDIREKFPQDFVFQKLVRPDGTLNLGMYGDVFVGGLTFDQIRVVIANKLKERGLKTADPDKVSVDVIQYNSQYYYVITDGAGAGQQMVRLPVTGNETVLDALSLIGGLSAVSSKHHLFLARRVPGPGNCSAVMKVDLCGIEKKGGTSTNYQLFPGDRLYVCCDPMRWTDTFVAKVLAPAERIMGFTLLTSQTVNSIHTNPNSTSSTGSGTGLLR